MFKILLSLALLCSTSGAVLADDWVATKLRGTVLEMVDGSWEKLSRGDIVPDDRLVRSLNGRATFQRGAETIDLASDTIIQIMDRDGAHDTVVVNHQGTVDIDAEARNVQHFSVVTPFLAAVVKGTQFSVSNDGVRSTLSVSRGTVQMRDTSFGQTISVTAGQSATTGSEPAEIVQSEPGAMQPFSLGEAQPNSGSPNTSFGLPSSNQEFSTQPTSSSSNSSPLETPSSPTLAVEPPPTAPVMVPPPAVSLPPADEHMDTPLPNAPPPMVDPPIVAPPVSPPPVVTPPVVTPTPPVVIPPVAPPTPPVTPPDDGNNGHGNDPGGVDPSNPGGGNNGNNGNDDEDEDD